MKHVVTDLPATIRKAAGIKVDHRFRKWCKWIDSVDTSKQDGYRFVGEFIRDGTLELELDRPRLVLAAAETGSAKYHNYDYAVVRLNPDLSIDDLNIRTDDLKSGWAIRLHASVERELAALAGEPAEVENPLAQFTTEQLRAELARREAVHEAAQS